MPYYCAEIGCCFILKRRLSNNTILTLPKKTSNKMRAGLLYYYYNRNFGGGMRHVPTYSMRCWFVSLWSGPNYQHPSFRTSVDLRARYIFTKNACHCVACGEQRLCVISELHITCTFAVTTLSIKAFECTLCNTRLCA